MLRIGHIIQRIDLLVFFLLFLLQMSETQTTVYLRFILLIIWCILVLLKGCGRRTTVVYKQMVALIVFLLCNLIRTYIRYTSLKTVLGSTLSILVLFSGFFVFDYYKERLSKKEKKLLVYGVLFVWLFYCFKALRFYKEHPGAARAIVSHRADYAVNGISDPYAIAYGSVLIEIVLLGILICGRKALTKIEVLGLVIYIAVLTVLIWNTESTITMFAMVVGIFLVLILNDNGQLKGNRAIKRSLFLIVGLVIVCLFLAYREDIGWWLINTFQEQSGVFAYKLMLVGESLIKKSAQGGLGSRVGLYTMSWKLFLQHPVFGVELLGIRFGEHSEFLDALAEYGILLGALPYFALFYYSLRQIRNLLGRQNYSALLVSFLLMFSLNPFHSNLSNSALMFIVPMIGTVWREREETVDSERSIKII